MAAMVGLALVLGSGLCTVSADTINPAAPGEGDAVHLVDKQGETLATVTVTDVKRDWTGYKPTFKPRQGVEFVAFTLEIEAVAGDLDLSSKEFDLQRDPGVLEITSNVQSENDDPPALGARATIEEGQSATYLVTYEVPEGSSLSQLFWAPEGAFLAIQYLGEE
jgi:hypothetical protein